MKVASFDIVFQEIPGEVTLALNLSNCPCHCPGCHSPHLAEDIGEPLTEELLSGLLDRYGAMITCVAFMGGDAEPETVAKWAEWIKNHKSQITNHKSVLRTAWYSGRPHLPECLSTKWSDSEAVCQCNGLSGVAGLLPFDYVKLGPYIEELGGLKSEKTNQRLYKRVGDSWEDITSVFWKKRFE
jgi:anaerobic ribonucleoside-triphosphate reductase activating protein